MITTKADKLLRSLIDAGLSVTEFTILATKIMRMQRNFKLDNDDRYQRDRLRQQNKLREQQQFDQQLKDEEQRRIQSLKKLKELGYLKTNENDNFEQNSLNQRENKDQLLIPYSKEINSMKQKQRDCCLTFNIDYDLRRNQQTLEKACRRAKRNIYELRAERFNRPESRSILSIETATLHSKLKESIREINKMFIDSKSNEEKRYFQELLTYINQFEGDIDLLMCQMQYEPKVKETLLFSPVTTDILDRMNLILHYVRTLSNEISNKNSQNENIQDEILNDLSNIPTKVTYIIKIQTNNDINSSLSNETIVSMKLYGTYNKSPDIRLLQSINKIKWQSGQIDLFNIELNYLGEIYAIEIWHDSQYSSWKVDWIEIIDDASNIYRFPINRLFDKYSDEKKTRFIIQRDIGPVDRLPIKPVKQIKPYKQIGFSTYTVQVKTGKQPNKVTDSLIFIQLKGENGNYADNLCSANSAFRSSVFEPDQLDTFYLVWPNLAKINSLHILVQSQGNQPAWFCEYINIEDGQTGDKYKFIVNQLFNGSNPDDPNLKRHLTVYPEQTNEKEEKEKPGYLMKIKTGEKGLSTFPPINIILNGDQGKSDPYTLQLKDNKNKPFQENQTDEFLIPSKYYIGPIKNLQLSSNDQVDKWFIENIIIRDITQGKDYVFPIYKSMKTQDGITNLTVQPINDRKPDYKVYTRTISSELKGPDRSIKLVVQGSKGKQEIELNNPVTLNNTFQPGRKDEFYIENMKSLGDLKSIELDITNPNIKKLGLDYIQIKDLTTNDAYRFNINRMLDSKNPKMTAKAELMPPPIAYSSKLNPNQLTLSNTTSTLSTKQNFDQLTKNVPQGAKRSDNQSKISIKVDENTDRLDLSDIEKKSISTRGTSPDNSYKNELSAISTEKSTSDQNKSSGKNNYKIKLKTINKEFLDKDTKLQIELIDENGQTIINPIETNLQKGKIDTINLDTNQDFGKLKNIKLSLIGSKLKKKNFYQPEFIEIFHPNINKTYRLDYAKDDILNSEQNRLELTKSIKILSDINIREKTQPQGTVSSIINKSSTSPYPKLSEQILSETDEENNSLPNQTLTSSISEKTPSRQIRPGDRVKNNSKKQLINPQSLHETDWYSRSIETNKDHRNEAKQMQLITNQHLSQTKFDQQQANLIKNDDQNQKIDRQISKEKKSSLRSLKKEKISKLPSYYQQYLNESQTEMMNVKTRKNSNISENTQIITKEEKILTPQPSSINQKRNSSDQEQQQKINNRSKQTVVSSTTSKQINDTDDPTDKMVVIESHSPSNMSELSKPSTTSYKPSKTLVKTSYFPSQKEESYDRIPNESSKDLSFTNKKLIETPSSSSYKNEHQIITSNTYNPISVLPTSRTTNNIPKRRSQSVSSSRKSSNISSTISKDQSQQIIKTSSPSHYSNQISYTSNPSVSESHLSNQLTKTSTSSISPKQKNFQRPQVNIIDSAVSEYDSQPNIQNISAVTIQTVATKSDSDLHSTRKSLDSHESEHSLQSKSLLSPDISKKSRKNTSKKEQTSVSQPSIISSNISTNNKYLSKETSDIQYASRPPSYKSRSDDISLITELKAPNTQSTTAEESKSSLNPSTTTTTTQNHSLSNEIIDTKRAKAFKKSSTNFNLPSEIDHMSTVYEESEPSTISFPNMITSSLTKHDSKQENIQDWLDTNSNIPLKTSSNDKSLSNLLPKSSHPSNQHKKNLNAKSIITPIKSNTSIDYEFRVQTGNESQLDGTNDSVLIELINTKDQSLKIPLINSINNSKPFQKGQLDIFHLRIPNNFHHIKQIKLYLPETTKDSLHIRYCELQDRSTMNTFYFPIEKWLGEKNAYNVEMYINNNSLFEF